MTEKQKSAGSRGFDLDPELQARIERAEAEIETFAYARPEGELAPGKKFRVRLAQTDSHRAQVQILKEDGENNLHYHANVDLIYMVLEGRVQFYGVGDELLGDFGPLEGIKLPQYSRYWFTSVGEGEAVLLQMAGYPSGAEVKKRISCEPPGQGVRWHEKLNA